jgi:UDP-N-acetylmuramoyl-L-alanyl-D-glutamate--2,6-diaminopimelate ligase
MTMVGITGTNGKTTTTHIVRELLEVSGKQSGLIGTIDYRFGDEIIAATHTTPESLDLQELLKKMMDKNCKASVMEVSSHALHQHRVHGIEYDVAVFTNLTQDHLDYHGSMEKYFEAKRMLFDSLSRDAWAIVNVDDEWGQKLFEGVSSKKLSFGTSDTASVKATKVSLSTNGTKFSILHNGTETTVETPLLGRFNVANLLAAFAAGIALGIDTTTMQKTFRTISPVRGRFERIISPKGWTAIIDYAHSPDALEKALYAVRDILGTSTKGNIITVFGCGGNRDRKKRPMMARVATELSNITVVTSDNPRHENPEAIIDEVMTGVNAGAKVYRESDRKRAIHLALEMSKENDVVLIAGKGHEEYQVIGDEKFPFSDRAVVEEYLRAYV